MKFRVVSEKTWQPIGFIRSLLRQLAHALDTFLCYIGYLLPLWDPSVKPWRTRSCPRCAYRFADRAD